MTEIVTLLFFVPKSLFSHLFPGFSNGALKHIYFSLNEYSLSISKAWKCNIYLSKWRGKTLKCPSMVQFSTFFGACAFFGAKGC